MPQTSHSYRIGGTSSDGTVRYTLPEADAGKIGDGTKVEVFYDKDASYDPANGDYRIQICATINYVGEITSVKRASGSDPRKITIEAAYDPYKTPTGESLKHFDFDTNDFAADDIVSFTFADGEVQSVTKLTNRVESALTRYSRNNSVTMRGSTYGYSGMIAFEGALLSATGANAGSSAVNTAIDKYDTTQNNPFAGDYNPSIKMQEALKTDDTYVVYVDEHNQAVWVEKADETDTTDGSSGYALVRWMESEGSDSKANNQARLIFTDGTQRTVDLYKDYIKDWYGANYTNYVDWADGTFINDDRPIVHYTRESNGTYRLTNRYQTGSADYASSSTAQIVNHFVTEWNAAGGANLTTNSSTIFMINDDGTYRRYIGRSNTPNVTISYTPAAPYAFAYMDCASAKYVWFTDSVAAVETYSKDITFIAPASRSDLYEDGSGWDETYYTYNAVVAGEIKTIEVSVYTDSARNPLKFVSVPGYMELDLSGVNDNARNGVILNSTTQNSSDRYTSGTFSSNSTTVNYAWGLKAASNGEIEVNTHNGETKRTEELLRNASLVNAYYVNDDGDITRLGSVYDIEADNSVYVFYTMNEDDQITNIFVCEDNS